MRARIVCIALAAILLAHPAPAQVDGAREGAGHVMSAFVSRADPGVLAENVRLGPALRAEFGADADSRRIYAALLERTADKPLRVRPVPADEAAGYASLVGGPGELLLVLEAGDAAFLMQYALKQKDVVFVEQLRGPKVELPPQAPAPAAVTPVPMAPEPPPAAAPVVIEKPKPAPIAVPKPAPVAVPKPAPVVVPKPAPVVVPKPAPARAEPSKPRGECVIKPVMTDDDLYNCSIR
jgi:hypothetical protein